MGRFSLAKHIQRKHGHDPGVSAGFTRCYAGIVEARKGIKRVESLLIENYGVREVEKVRTKLDEAELWISAAIHAVRSEPFPPGSPSASHQDPIPAPDGATCEYRIPDGDGGWDACGKPAILMRRHRRHGRRHRAPWPVCKEHSKRRV